MPSPFDGVTAPVADTTMLDCLDRPSAGRPPVAVEREPVGTKILRSGGKVVRAVQRL